MFFSIRRFFIILTIPFIFCFGCALRAGAEKPIVVIIPSYNNIKWYKKNLSSVFEQRYSNYRVIYIDDCSTDDTGNAVEKYVTEKNQQHRFKLERNYERVGALANLYGAIHSCKDNEIIVLIDGDDWLYHPNVFKELNKVYNSGEVWFTHGKMTEYPTYDSRWGEPIPPHIIEQKAYRTYKHPTHLRTFYAWIFKKIRLQDFLYNGEFLRMAWDMAIMFPLSEMAEERHVYITDVNYVYNICNPINDCKVDAKLQQDMERLIRNRPPYQRLEKAEQFNPG